MKEWFIHGIFALLSLPYKLQIQGVAKVCINRTGSCLLSWIHFLALLCLFTQIQVDPHIIILAHSHPTRSFLKRPDLTRLHLAWCLLSGLKAATASGDL